MLEVQAHICWVITVDYKVRLGQVKSEFNWKRPKLTRSGRALKLSRFCMKSHRVRMRGTREFEKKKDGGFFIMSTEKYLAFDAVPREIPLSLLIFPLSENRYTWMKVL